MPFSSWQRNWMRTAPAARRRTQVSPRQPTGFRPRLEALDDRWLPSGLPYPTAATATQLIADIKYADKAGGAFTINPKPGATFDLKSVDNTTGGANGLPVVGGMKAVALTIAGNGDTIERVGSKSFRLWDLAPAASLTLDHVTLRQGLASGSGGAIYNQGTLMVSDCTVSRFSGGGISNAGGTVTVSDSTLSGNAAGYGGGISNAGGTVTVSDSTLSSNGATNGGGIYNGGGTVTLSNGSTLYGNYVTPDDSFRGGNGGGIYNSGGTVTVSNSILLGNTTYGWFGGGIYDDAGGTVTVENSSSITGTPAVMTRTCPSRTCTTSACCTWMAPARSASSTVTPRFRSRRSVGSPNEAAAAVAALPTPVAMPYSRLMGE
jgi:hypothetical protein